MKEKFITLMTLNFLPNMLALVSLYFKTKYLPIEIFAQINFATVYLGFFTMFLDLGITGIHYQYTYKPNFNEYVGSYMFIKILLIFINFTIPIILLFFNPYDQILKTLILINIINGIFAALIELLRTNLQIRLKIMKKEFPFFVFRTIISFIEIYICLFTIINEYTAVIIYLTTLFINIIQFICYIFLNRNENLSINFNKDKIKEYFKDSTPLILQSIISVLNTYIGMFILGNQQGIVEMTYYSFINLYIINIFINLTITSTMMFDTLFPKLIDRNNISAIREIQNLFEKYVSLIFMAIIILVQINAEFLFKTFIPNLYPSVYYLRYLIFVPYLDAILRPYMNNLIQGKKQGLSSTISIINILLGVILQIIFVSDKFLNLGAIGLVIISLFFNIENNIILRYTSKKYFGLRSNVRYLIHFLGLALSLIVGFILLNMVNIEQNTIISNLIASSASLLVFLLVLIFSKEIQKEDVDFLLSILNIKKYIKSFKEEFQPNEKE